MMAQNFLQNVLESFEGRVSRSTVLKPLNYLLGFLIFLLISAYSVDMPLFIGKATFIAILIIVAIYLGVYVYFAITNPDALRSEWFMLNRYALEQKAYGDDISGLIESLKGAQKQIIDSHQKSPSGQTNP